MMQDGQTATNPQTGEKVVLRGGQWVPLGQRTPAPAPAPVPAPAAPDRIYGAPKQVDPIEAERLNMARQDQARQNRIAPLDEEAKRLELQLKQKQLADGDPADDPKGTRRRAALEAIVQQINRVEQLYGDISDDASRWSVGLGLPAVPTSDNKQFDAASAGLAEQGLSAFRVPGVGAQSDTELRQFVEANRPSASDFNAAALEKIRQLKMRVDTERASLGMPPANWASTMAGQGGTPSAPSVPVPPGTQPPTDGVNRSTLPMADGGLGTPQVSSDTKTIADPWVQQHGSQLSKLMVSGATDEAIREFIRSTGGSIDAEAALKARRTPEGRRWIKEKGYWPIDPNKEVPLQGQEKNDAADAASPLGSFVEGLSHAPVSAIEGAIALSGNRPYAEEMERKRQLMAANNPGVNLAGHFASALVLPGATKSIPGVIGTGAGYGFVNSFGGTPGDVGDRLTAGVEGGALGAGMAGGLGAAARAPRLFPNRPPPGGPQANALAQAAQEEGVPISRPIVDPQSRSAMAYLESSIGSGSRVRNALEGTRSGIERRAAELGAGGTALDEVGAGTVVQNAGRRFIERTGDRARQLYDRAAQTAGNNPVQAREAVRVLDDQIAELSRNANSNAPMISYLKELRGDFVDDSGNLLDKSVGDIRNMRTQMRGNISARGLTATDADRRIGMVLDAARTDIQRDLGTAAPAAVRQYQRADQYYRARQAEVASVVQRVLGRTRDVNMQLSPEKAWAAVKGMAGPRGDSATLARMWKKLEPGEQRDAAATIAETMGRRSIDEPFSPALFVNSARALSKEARETLFGPDGARSISNLRLLSEAYRDTAARLNNSRSGQVQQWGQFLRSFVPTTAAGATGGALLGGPAGAVTGAAIMAGGGAGVRNISARMLMSPNMTRWLANAPRATTPQQIRRAINGLSTVASRDPSIANEALGLQRYLQQAISQTPSKAAAQDDNQ